MRKLLILFFIFIPIIIFAQENILSGHIVESNMPDLVLIITDTEIGTAWTGPLILQIDGKDSAKIILPTAVATLPKRKWVLKDYLITTGVSILSLGLGAAIISIFN